MSFRASSSPPLSQTTHGSLGAMLLPGLFRNSMSIGGKYKRKVDGELAETRLGKVISSRWTNERFRQVMLLVLEFRREWPSASLLSNEDVEFIRVAVDVALSEASKEGHVGDMCKLL